jgi:hypothetical protein
LDPTVIHNASRAFDAAFVDHAGAILGKDPPDESDFGSRGLKERVIAKLHSSKRRLHEVLQEGRKANKRMKPTRYTRG